MSKLTDSIDTLNSMDVKTITIHFSGTNSGKKPVDLSIEVDKTQPFAVDAITKSVGRWLRRKLSIELKKENYKTKPLST